MAPVGPALGGPVHGSPAHGVPIHGDYGARRSGAAQIDCGSTADRLRVDFAWLSDPRQSGAWQFCAWLSGARQSGARRLDSQRFSAIWRSTIQHPSGTRRYGDRRSGGVTLSDPAPGDMVIDGPAVGDLTLGDAAPGDMVVDGSSLLRRLRRGGPDCLKLFVFDGITCHPTL